MATRAIWSGSIGFGLVNIPVGLYSATQDSSLSLNMLDKHDGAKIKYQRINETTGEEVAWGDIVKGYKLNNNYVVLDDDDFALAAPKKSQMIEIEEFVTEDQIDSTYYEAPYYLAPKEGGDKAYVLLRDALADSKKLAIGTYVMRSKEHICALKAIGDALVLLRLRFPEEIRDTKDLDLPGDITIKPAELKMAKSLIDQLTPKKFSLDKYKDTYDAELLKIIHKKAKGQKITEPKFHIVKTKTKDLMAQLKASLDDGKPAKRTARSKAA